MTSSNPRLIPGKSVPGDLVTWEAPEVQKPETQSAEALEAEIIALREQAVREGYQAGHAEGMAAAQADVTAQVTALNQVLNTLARPMEDLDLRVEEELLELVRAIARQLIRRELRTEPGEVVNVIRAGLDALPTASGDVVVRLHPEDASLVRDLLQPTEGETPWRIQADPVLERGGCQIIAESSQIDGRLETRLGRAIASLFEDERDEESREHD